VAFNGRVLTTATDHAAERRLFADGRFFTPDTRARFYSEEHRPLPEAPDAEYPLLLLTGRGTVAQWHTETRTRQSAVLRKLAPAGLIVEVHPGDAQLLNLHVGQRVVIESRRGTVSASVLITATMQRGQIFLPMHHAGVNRLTHAVFDPYSFQPSYKDCAVRLRSSFVSSEQEHSRCLPN
jgi:predicted molibdopterin-dependent oxidoreductase YjgC